MIDTVCLVIPAHDVKIKNYDVFSPSAKGLFESPYYTLGGKGYFQCVFNPQVKNIYNPRLTLTKRYQRGTFSINLKIEFSIPKLLYTNNFQEVDDTHFEKVIDYLYTRIYVLGIIIEPDILRKATLSTIHYSRNITLNNYVTSDMIVRLISKCDLSKRLDIGNTDFRNEGHAVRFHTNSYELTFYDKMKDLEQAKISEKRAIEKDNDIQLSLFDEPQVYKPKPEVLRVEVRLNSKKKIKDMLQRLDIDKELTLKDLYSSNISKQVLLHFWDKIEPTLRISLLSQTEPDILLYKLISSGTKPRKAMETIGTMKLIEKIGIRGLKNLLKRQSYSILKEIENIELNTSLIDDLKGKIEG